MADSTETTHQLLATLPAGIVLRSESGDITWANPTMLQLTGNASDAPLSEDAKALLSNCITCESPFQIPESDTWLSRKVFPLNNGGTETQAYLFEDYTTTHQALQQLEQTAPVDSITGLSSQYSLQQGLQALLSQARRYERALSIILLEINNLDQLAAGSQQTHDELLLTIGRQLKEHIRWADLIGRYDGDKFLMILPETALDDTQGLIDKLLPQLSAITLPSAPEQPIKLELNHAAAEFNLGDDSNRMIQRAQSLLEN